jgi:redox-sensing transcriptional repressor
MLETKKTQSISKQLLKRLPNYLVFLKTVGDDTVKYISAPTVAQGLGLNEVQVRKDLAAVSSTAGKPKSGFAIKELIRDIENFLGYNNVDEAVIVGAGHLGKAFLSHKGFEEYGLKILVAFDNDEALIGTEFCGKKILPIESLEDFCRRVNIHIGIITVPAEFAQSVCDRMVEGGIRAIWNFASVHLNVPEQVLVHNENMANSLVTLSKHLEEKMSVI